jgi:hypothetical protein
LRSKPEPSHSTRICPPEPAQTVEQYVVFHPELFSS